MQERSVSSTNTLQTSLQVRKQECKCLKLYKHFATKQGNKKKCLGDRSRQESKQDIWTCAENWAGGSMLLYLRPKRLGDYVGDVVVVFN